MTVPFSLTDLFVCPACRGELEHQPASSGREGLCCGKCAVLYPINDGIPVMLIEEAMPLAQTEKKDPQK